MAQFRTTADIVDSILRRAGEVTNGNSAFEADALEYLNRVHHAILAGGSIFNMDVDEAWTWAHSKSPIILELQPAYETGTVSVTNGSEAGTFSSAPTSSLEGWHIRINNDPEVYQIKTHTAGGANFELDGNYVQATAAAATFKCYKLDYEIVQSHITIDANNNKIDFTEPGGTTATATLSAGVYTPAALATELVTQIEAAGTSQLDVSASYDSNTRKFTLTINTAEANVENSTIGGFSLALASATVDADRVAQQVLTTSAFTIKQVGLMEHISGGSTGIARWELQGDNGSNEPNGTILATFDVDISTLPTSASSSFTYYNLSTNVALSAATKYWLVGRRNGAISGNYYQRTQTGGTTIYNKSSADAGSAWSAGSTSTTYIHALRGNTLSLEFASGSNAIKSAAKVLGFDDEDRVTAASHESTYVLSGISRLIEPFKLQRNSAELSQLNGLDKSRFSLEYPVHKTREGLPEAFTKIEEDQDGRIWVRFDAYPKEVRRVEVTYIPVPRDLKDNAVSRPELPRKEVDVLEYGAAFYLCLDKEDSKADVYGNLAKQGLESMQKRNRNELRKVDANFAQITPRPEYLEKNFRRLRYGYSAGD